MRTSIFGVAAAALISHAQQHNDQEPLFERLPACDQLQERFPTKVFHPHDERYHEAQKGYWNMRQTELQPSCHFFPNAAADVRSALLVLVSSNTSFALVSGGHSGKPAASNIDGPGVTINLSSLNDISLTEAGDSVQVGPGASWSEVYAFLEPYGLTVAGARDGHVGVGGFVLGGGLSWFGNQAGWSCDTIEEIEFVTPDCQIIHINSSSSPDLFHAVKGSLGTFGVVTGLTTRTIRIRRGLYGGAIVYDVEELPKVFAALHRMGHETDGDIFTHGYVSIGYSQKFQSSSYVAYLINTMDDLTAPTLATFQRIRHKYLDFKSATVRQSAEELSNMDPPGLRRIKFTLTTLMSPKVMEILHQTLRQAADELPQDAEGILGMMYQPLTQSHLSARSNIFADRLSHLREPLLLVSVECWWQDAGSDHAFETQIAALHTAMQSQLRNVGALHPWIYPNYAAAWQSPLGSDSLGLETFDRLDRIRRNYDQHDVWRRLPPGMW